MERRPGAQARILMALRERPMRVVELAELLGTTEQSAIVPLVKLRDAGLICKCPGDRLAPWEPTERGWTCDLSELPATKGMSDGSIDFLLAKADERRRLPHNAAVLYALQYGPLTKRELAEAAGMDLRMVDRVFQSVVPQGKVVFRGRPGRNGGVFVLTPKGTWELVCILTGWPIDGYLRGDADGSVDGRGHARPR